MACGTPVVTSRGTALEEVAGGAALLADPGDPGEIALAMEAALGRRQELAAAGLCRARLFSWKEAAALTVEAFRAAYRSHLAEAHELVMTSKVM